MCILHCASSHVAHYATSRVVIGEREEKDIAPEESGKYVSKVAYFLADSILEA